MPTWQGDPRPYDEEPDRSRNHYARDEPVLVRHVNSQDALEAFFAIFWDLLVLAWYLLVFTIQAVVWIIRKVTRRGASHVARRSSRHR